MTPASVARLLTSMFSNLDGELHVLDAGAGVGSLSAALIERAIEKFQPSSITAHAWEIEDVLVEHQKLSISECASDCQNQNVELDWQIHKEDFISAAVSIINARSRGQDTLKFNKAILNPPYLKIAANGDERAALRSVGVETGNLYSCFVSLALMLLDDGGELVAITPRSFCNGPYFKDFRRVLLDGNALCKIHVFDSRNKAFKGDKVLQENVIFHIKKGQQQQSVDISSSSCADDDDIRVRTASFDEVVQPGNPERFIHIVTSDEEAEIAKFVGNMPCSLDDLEIQVSTGKVVDFRTKENLRMELDCDSVPLIYPMHFNDSEIEFPISGSKKPNAIALNDETMSLMVPNGTYVLTKRLTAKEENRRVVASLYTDKIAKTAYVGFENKTNYFHNGGNPLDTNLAKGLLAYLNSSVIDQYFRQFNGHTQVNATDLRSLRYPSHEQLVKMGSSLVEGNSHNYDDLLQKSM
ncbi:Eco57I restriction-modification methylase domain-containing protein [Aeromonas sp. MR19]|uniref:Eco57I restriction-modification methylase domain-containing protein n=1 Tax=Aeromonas sp. MR19 TaxID=2923421 RepID=UPI001F4B462F|nr:Eco57I restriction-modification methylase domain-containing protein [Aeromonas sp. MR19]MCH7377402.1 Eco57I restriction-modification methylase domain-containing protein [Aeromonas sp. MR19]